MAFAASVVTIFPLAQRQEIWNSVWKAKATRLDYCQPRKDLVSFIRNATSPSL
jgi:hypothetical protein